MLPNTNLVLMKRFEKVQFIEWKVRDEMGGINTSRCFTYSAFVITWVLETSNTWLTVGPKKTLAAFCPLKHKFFLY